MFETLMEDTVSKHSLSAKSESVPNHYLRTILKPNCPGFEPYLEKLSSVNRKPPIQLVKTSDVALHILFPKVQMIKSK